MKAISEDLIARKNTHNVKELDAIKANFVKFRPMINAKAD